MTITHAFNQWSILGAGAIGCLWASEFAKADIACELIVRDQQTLDSYSGIAVKNGTKATYEIHAAIASQLQQPIDHLLVCTKAQQTLTAIQSIKHCMSDSTVIVLLQNGMGVADELNKIFPNNPVLLASTTAGANLSAPFKVNKAGEGSTLLGAYQAQANLIGEKILELLPPRLLVEWQDNIKQALWLKLLVNSVINPLTAIYNCPNGELLQRADIQQQLQPLCTELCHIANACGYSLSVEDLYQQVINVATDTAQNISSMLQDVRKGKETEIEYINGFICRQAELHQLPAPLNTALVTQVSALKR